ncbi:phosphate transport system substrate-binding protein [Candidatus Electrothrix marina]|uniref:Phosphate transport system substrate-binding protein n=1 Tax=Candidatus Electrothrix marina TaxID=1859130 RepID=A0A3S4TBG5_9BACT|nr:phosphate transport system substrate-binding protein [Candidatus Electrothrix marina]
MKKTLLIAACMLLASDVWAGGRDYVSLVGSSTVYPFATTVAERFGKTSSFKTPKIESTGSGGGMKLFCAGTGIDTPDITNCSRRMKKSEYDDCVSNGVKEITEVKIGYDGIVVANSKKAARFSLTKKDLYLALARSVPDPKGGKTFVDNPYKTWKEVNPALPDRKIEVMGPPPTSGTRDAFDELAMQGGCKTFPWVNDLKKTNKEQFKAVCQALREDGVYIEAGENDNLIIQKLEVNPDSLGIFGFSYLDQNADKIQGAVIDGVAPDFDHIASGSYSISRPLYMYVKNSHVGAIPGMEEFLSEFTSDRAWGDEGYLSEKGLIPMPEEERAQVEKAVKELTPLQL